VTVADSICCRPPANLSDCHSTCLKYEDGQVVWQCGQVSCTAGRLIDRSLRRVGIDCLRPDGGGLSLHETAIASSRAVVTGVACLPLGRPQRDWLLDTVQNLSGRTKGPLAVLEFACTCRGRVLMPVPGANGSRTRLDHNPALVSQKLQKARLREEALRGEFMRQKYGLAILEYLGGAVTSTLGSP
jgi:hypothetical protein